MICLATITFSARAQPHNVIIMLADDLGWTDLTGYGSHFYQTPHLDQLARDGLKFTQAYAAAAVCSPTRAALLTGKYPARLNLTDWIPFKRDYQRPWAQLKEPVWTQQLPLSEVTLAEVFKRSGYHTAHLGKWHLGEPNYYPEKHGFDINIGGTSYGLPPGGYFLPNQLKLEDVHEGEYLTDYLTRKTIDLIQDWNDDPFFIQLSYYAVHKPIEAKPEEIKKYKNILDTTYQHQNAVYAAMISSLDQSVGRIRQALKSLNLEQNTIIIFLSDNGGLTHNEGNFLDITSNLPLRRGKGAAYEGGLRVPMIIYWPQITQPGTTTEAMVNTIDIYPTLVHNLGLEQNEIDVDGLDLLPLLSDPDARLNRSLMFWHYPHYHPGSPEGPYGVIRQNEWKLIEFYEDGIIELYNLGQDLAEQHDLSNQYPEKVSQMLGELGKWMNQVNAAMPKMNFDFTPGKARQAVWPEVK